MDIKRRLYNYKIPYDKASYFFLACMLFLLPLLFRKVNVQLSVAEQMILGLQAFYTDTFNYFKIQVYEILFVLFTCAVLIYFYKESNNRLSTMKAYAVPILLVILFAGFAWVSTITAKYEGVFIELYGDLYPEAGNIIEKSSVQWHGFYQRYEGFYLWMSYLLLYVFILLLPTKTRYMVMLVKVTFLSSVVVAVVACLQLAGFDLLTVPWIQKFAVEGELFQQGVVIKKTSHYDMITSTLYNANNLGQYLAMVMPLGIYCFLSSRRVIKWMYFAGVLLVIGALLGSKSSVAILATIMILVIWSVLSLMFKVKRLDHLWLVIGFVGLFILMNSLNQQQLIEEISDSNNNEQVTDTRFIQLLEVERGLQVTLGDEVMLVTQEDTMIVRNLQGETLQEEVDYGGVSFVGGGESQVVYFIYQGMTIPIYWYRGEFYVIGTNSVYYPIEYESDYVSLPVSDSFGTNRGYIWSRTLPLCLDSWLVGYGADTIAFAFPQHEYWHKLMLYGKANTMIDKPHNQYLNIWVSFGFVALVLFLGLGLYVVIRMFREQIIFYKKNQYPNELGMAMLSVLIAYFTTSVAYDSMIVVSVLFWVFLSLSTKCEDNVKR